MHKLAFLFPGQGSQYIGMGKKLFDEFLSVRRTFEEAGDILNVNVRELCFEGDLNRLNQTQNTQPAILTVSIAAFRVYMDEIGVNPSYCAGHSLGEISALTSAGVIDFKDALEIVRQRGRLMQAAATGPGLMAAISGISSTLLKAECEKHTSDKHIVVVANYNSSLQSVVSGNAEAVNLLVNDLKLRAGIRISLLKVSAPFHSSIMRPAATRFRDILTQYQFKKPLYPVISNVDCSLYLNEDQIVDKLVRQIISPVRWDECVKYLVTKKVNTVVELGPKEVLSNLIKQDYEMNCFSLADEQAVETFKKIPQLKNPLSYMPNIITKCMVAAIGTPNYNWDEEQYFNGVIKSYRKLKKLYENIEKDAMNPNLSHVNEALSLLKLILATKQISKEDQISIFSEILDETETKDLISSTFIYC